MRLGVCGFALFCFGNYVLAQSQTLREPPVPKSIRNRIAAIASSFVKIILNRQVDPTTWVIEESTIPKSYSALHPVANLVITDDGTLRSCWSGALWKRMEKGSSGKKLSYADGKWLQLGRNLAKELWPKASPVPEKVRHNSALREYKGWSTWSSTVRTTFAVNKVNGVGRRIQIIFDDATGQVLAVGISELGKL